MSNFGAAINVIVVGLIGGIAVGLQGPMSGAMSQRVGPLGSSLVIHLGGAVFSAVLLLILRGVEWQAIKALPLPYFFAGLFGNDADWNAELTAAAEASGDHLWLMPLHETFARYNESTFADLKNSSDLRQAQPAYAARFLQEFAGDGPWAHLDIAGTAFLERGRGDYYSGKGATGYGVRLLTELARRLS